MPGTTQKEFDDLVASMIAGNTWEAAVAAVAPGWVTEALKLKVLATVHFATASVDGLSTTDIRRLGDAYAVARSGGLDAAAAWAAAKAKFPLTTDNALEAHKAAALAWASDHPRFA